MFRVLFITEDDPLYVPRFFEVFFAEAAGEFDIAGMTISTAFHESRLATARRLWRLYGAVGFGRLLARVAGAKMRGVSPASCAARADVPLLPTRSVNDPEYVARVRALAPDVIVSVAAPEIFRTPLLQSARLGCVNTHSGRLPAYRGMLPTFWQMRQGERAITITVHEMAEALDAGPVLGTRDYPIRVADSLDRIITETKRESARLMISVLRQLRDGTATRQPLDMATAGYFTFPTRADARAFHQRGHRLL